MKSFRTARECTVARQYLPDRLFVEVLFGYHEELLDRLSRSSKMIFFAFRTCSTWLLFPQLWECMAACMWMAGRL